MQKLERKIPSLIACLAVALLAMPPGVKAQSAGEPEKQEPVQEQQQAQDNNQAPEQVPEKAPATAPARRAVPHVTGTVTRMTASRIDLKTPEGKVQKVAVNQGTEWLVDAKEGTEVKVEYRRKVSGFVIAERVLPAGEDTPAAQPGKGTAPGQNARAVTGSVVSWNNTALVLRTEAGDVTLFLSPSTEYLVKSLDPGLRVSVEYEGSDRARVATRVLAVKAKDEDSAKKSKDESGSE